MIIPWGSALVKAVGKYRIVFWKKKNKKDNSQRLNRSIKRCPFFLLLSTHKIMEFIKKMRMLRLEIPENVWFSFPQMPWLDLGFEGSWQHFPFSWFEWHLRHLFNRNPSSDNPYLKLHFCMTKGTIPSFFNKKYHVKYIHKLNLVGSEWLFKQSSLQVSGKEVRKLWKSTVFLLYWSCTSLKNI